MVSDVFCMLRTQALEDGCFSIYRVPIIHVLETGREGHWEQQLLRGVEVPKVLKAAGVRTSSRGQPLFCVCHSYLVTLLSAKASCQPGLQRACLFYRVAAVSLLGTLAVHAFSNSHMGYLLNKAVRAIHPEDCHHCLSGARQ